MQKTGIILTSLAGFYDVEDSATHEIITCRGCGRFRKDGQILLVGDQVTYHLTEGQNGYITKLNPRENQLTRPPIANVSLALIVFSAKEPAFNIKFLDRLLAVIEAKQIKPVIIVSKIDLLTPTEAQNLEPTLHYYQKIGYLVIKTSTKSATGLAEIKAVVNKEIVVICGQSGVGKSSILNAIEQELKIEVNAISKALGRGKHTTRQVKLYKLAGGLVADTPGFSALELDELVATDLKAAFIEFTQLQEMCKFRGCMHVNEPNCAVKNSVDTGELRKSRYEDYLQLLDEIQNRKVKY